MTIDVHAHYVPQSLIAAARQRGTDMGVRVIDGAATPALEFSYGFQGAAVLSQAGRNGRATNRMA